MAFDEGHFRAYCRVIASGNTPTCTLRSAAVAILDTAVGIVVDASHDTGTACCPVVADLPFIVRVLDGGMAPTEETTDKEDK